MKFILLLLLIPFYASASEVFRCEVDGKVTYSQFKCGDGGKKIEVKATSHPPAPLKTDVEKACLEHLKLVNVWKDPESLRIEGSHKEWDTDSSGARHLLYLRINAKNSYGAYSGAESYFCFLNHSGDELSVVQHFIRDQ